jgi:RimJ/RimL family protein N-acetyltransferase
MLQLGIKFAFELYGAQKVSLGVFENNLPAYYCYKAAGFQDVILDTVESYSVIGEEWLCRELAIEKE